MLRPIVHGMSHLIGSVEVGKLADLVLYKPENFGTKPEMVIKGGAIAWAQMGDANASIPTGESAVTRGTRRLGVLTDLGCSGSRVWSSHVRRAAWRSSQEQHSLCQQDQHR